jgi:four helix bundle protein
VADLSERLYDFALKIVQLVRGLPKEATTFEIGRQLLRSGTSIAANYEEAKAAFSREDFTYKMSISFKEAKETNFWLRILRDSKIIGNPSVKELIAESDEIQKILVKSVKTLKDKK